MINLNPFINLIGSILSIYAFLLFIYIIMYYLTIFNIINRYSKIVIKVNGFLYKIFEPVLAKIRRYIPNISGIDISVIVLFLLIHFSKDVLYTYFYVF